MTKITRIEVIDENGRSYVNWEDDNDVSWQFQDDGRTLKVFVDKVKPKSPVEEAYKKVFGYYPVTDVGDAYWEYFQNGYNAAKEEEPEDTEWKSVALRFGEELSDVGPCGYYEFTAEEWFDWVVNTYEKICDDTVKLLKKEKVKKSKINDLAEKLLPDDHPYKIADEHGETNPYKQYLNSVEDEKKMEELGFVKNSDGSWTARPLGETAQERGERVHKEMEETIKIHDGYGVVDVKTNWKPKPQTHEEVSDGLKEAFREAIKQGIIPEVDKVSDEFMDEMVAKLKGKTLRDVCMEWWNDPYHKDCINDLISRIEEWLPKPQSAAGSQNAYVECTVEGFNDCLDKIKRKLR